MKKVLIITQLFPFPPHINGETSTLFHLIKSNYVQNFAVDILYLENERNASENVLEEDTSKIYNVPANKKEIFMWLDGKIVIKPRGLWSICSKSIKDLDVREYDYIILGSLVETCIIEKLIKRDDTIIILFAADSPVLRYYTKNKNAKNVLYRIYNGLQSFLWKNYKKAINKYVTKVAYVSEKDSEIAKKIFPKEKVITARIGVEEYAESYDVNFGDVINIGFSGIMTYEPNHDAVEYILNKIVPLLEKKGVNYRIHIIGKNPDEKWKHYLNNEKIVITGFIDNIEAYIASMDIYISPLLSGSGMKNKILQALSIGVPIIASQVSVDGIEGLKSGYNYLLCDDIPENWCNQIIGLYNDTKKRQEFSNRGKELIHNDYSWERFARDLFSTSTLSMEEGD